MERVAEYYGAPPMEMNIVSAGLGVPQVEVKV
jgi:hypothetical protein